MTMRNEGALRAALLFVLLVACRSPRPIQEPAPAPTVVDPPREPVGLYRAEEALRDALLGGWEYVGTGPWPGNSRMHACVFRNERVFVVNVYCGITDTQAFRLEVYSPTRGRVRVTAESRAPVSERVRADYFSFVAESEPPPTPTADLPQLDLRMTFLDLLAYEEKRYGAYLPACYGGMELNKERSGCLGPLASLAPTWMQENAAFLAQANDDWYRLVRELRALATRYGRDPD